MTQRFIFCSGIDLISSDICALICFDLGRFSYKLDITDLVACVLWLCFTVEGYLAQTLTPEGAILPSLAATVHRFCFMLGKEKHIFLPGVHLTYHPDTHHSLTSTVNTISNLLCLQLTVLWLRLKHHRIDKQIRLTRGRVFTDTISNRSDLSMVRKITRKARMTRGYNHGSCKGSFQCIMIVVYCFHTNTCSEKNALNCSPEYLCNNDQRGTTVMLKVWALTCCFWAAAWF